MAYTNSVEQGLVPFEAGTTFSRGLMWAAIAVVVFVLATVVRLPLAQDARLADLRRSSSGSSSLTLAIGERRRRARRAGSPIGPLTFQFSEIAKILMIVVLASYLAGRAGPPRLAAAARRCLPARSARRSRS